MLHEHDLIPFQAAHLPPGPWLVVAPHPDDEVFGMGGSIALASRNCIRVEVLVMTGGEGAGDPQVRREECGRAGEVLGVAKHHFWNLPDGSVSQVDISPVDLDHILSELRPQTVFLPGIQEFHPDHRATTGHISNLLQAWSYQGEIWLYEVSRHNEANRLVDISAVIQDKIAAIHCFPSQLALVDYERIALGLNQARSYTLGHGIEYAEGFFAVHNPLATYASYARKLNSYVQEAETIDMKPWPPNTIDPIVSIIIPSYNHRRYIARAIESVLEQSFSDFELLIIDDASTDGSQEVIQAFTDPRIRFWANKENIGSAETINQGLRWARGRYVSILNSDDYYHPRRIELLVQDCEENDIEFAATDIQLVDGNGTPILDKKHWWIEWFETLKSRYTATQDLFQGILWGNFFITTSNFFLRRDVFAQIGAFYDYHYVLDYEFILRFLAYKPEAIKFRLDSKLLSYRLHGLNTIRKDPVGANRETHSVLIQWFAEYLSRQERLQFQAMAHQLSTCLGHVERETIRSLQSRYQEIIDHKDLELADSKAGQETAEERIHELMGLYARLESELAGKEVQIQELKVQLTELTNQALKASRQLHAGEWVFPECTDVLPLHGEQRSLVPGQNGGGTLSIVREVIQALAQEVHAFQNRLQEKEHEIALVRSSRSFRWGHAFLQPFRWIQRVVMR